MAEAKKTAKKAPAKKAAAKKPAPVVVPTTTIGGKEYEVTPEGGHRLKK